MRKLLLGFFVILLPLVFLSSTIQAGQPDTQAPHVQPMHDQLDLSHMHFTAGVAYSNFPASSFWLTVGGFSKYWLIRAAGALFIADNNPGIKSFALFCGTLHLGLRKELVRNVGFEYGVTGGIITKDKTVPNSVVGYSVGPFVGIDAIVWQHFLIVGTIQPYTYRRNNNNSIEHAIFGQGMLSFSYIFG